MALSADGTQIAVTTPNTDKWLIWRLDGLDGLMARGCEWLHHHLTADHGIGDNPLQQRDRQMCGLED